MSTLYYIHDPMCSWCWAYQPVLAQLKSTLAAHYPAEQLKMIDLLGGLAPDSADPMPLDMQRAIQSYWRTIERDVGRPFNFDFWAKNTPRRSTYPACRAVLSAEVQDQADAMSKAIQEAYYLRALNPSDDLILIQLATDLQLNIEAFKSDLNAQHTQQNLDEQIQQSRALSAQGFPSWILVHQDKRYQIVVDYHHPQPTLAQIEKVLTAHL